MLETEAGEQEGVEGGRGPRGILHIQGQEEFLWPFFQSIYHSLYVEI